MIRLSRLTDYAITILTQMVRNGKTVWAASELAAAACLPLPTTSKILKQLAKSKIISAQRGATGGYKLERAPAEISMATIIEAMDGPIAITDCAEGSTRDCNVESICAMSGNWDKINRAIRQSLESVSLAEMAVPHSPKPVTEKIALAANQ